MQRLALYWKYSTRSLARGGQRTLLALFCVAVGVMAIVALQLVGNMVNQALTGNVRAGNGGDVQVRSDITPLNAQAVQQFAKLKSDGTITDYTAADNQQVAYRDASGKVQRYQFWAVDPAVFPLAGSPDWVTPANGSLSSILRGGTVVVTDTLLTQLGLHNGDSLTVNVGGDGRTLDATIGGVVKGSGFFSGAKLFASLDYYQSLPSSSGAPISYSAVYANVPGHTDANEDAAKKAIGNALPLATVTTTKDALQQNQQVVGYVRSFLQIIGLLALLIGGVGIMNTMQVLLRRRRIEIAMLKTSGYRQADLYALFGLEAALLGLVGGAIGAAAGVGVSFVVRDIVANTIGLQLPSAIDTVTVLSGVAIGLFTALIFGIMPIVQSSQVRPQAVLRDLPEGTTPSTIGLSILLLAVLAVLFFLLTWAILQNLPLAIGAVLGAGVFLGLLSGVFTVIVLLINHFPVVERFRWWYLLLLVGAFAISGLVFVGSRPLGSIFLVVSFLGVVLVVLPRSWKANVKMALRNIGRQRARTVTTLVALYIGIFSIGLILSLGQNVSDQINKALNNTSLFAYNTIVFASANDKAAVDAKIASFSGVKGERVNTEARANPVSVDGVPIGDIINSATQGGGQFTLAREELLAYLSIPEGYDLANNQLPDVTIASDAQHAPLGRNLTSADAGTNNVLLPVRAMLAPLNAKVGSQILLASQDGKQTMTVTVAGFYCTIGATGCPTSNVFSLGGGGMYSDNSVPMTLGGSQLGYIYSLNLNPQNAAAQVNAIEQAVPSAQAITLTDISLLISNYLNDAVELLTAVASLAMIAGIIIIANAVALAMLERRRELGILKAIGHTSSDVLGEVLIENGIVGFTGGLLAMLLVTLAMALLAALVFQSSFGVSAPITVGIILASAAVCMAVAAGVAWGATRVRPIEVLRYE